MNKSEIHVLIGLGIGLCIIGVFIWLIANMPDSIFRWLLIACLVVPIPIVAYEAYKLFKDDTKPNPTNVKENQ